MTLTLPFPPASLSPNRARSLHWAAKAGIAREYREACGWAARADWGTSPPLTPPVALTVTFVVGNGRRYDRDNLIAAFKAGQDGLVDAGVIDRDDWQALTVAYAVERGPKAEVRIEHV